MRADTGEFKEVARHSVTGNVLLCVRCGETKYRSISGHVRCSRCDNGKRNTVPAVDSDGRPIFCSVCAAQKVQSATNGDIYCQRCKNRTLADRRGGTSANPRTALSLLAKGSDEEKIRSAIKAGLDSPKAMLQGGFYIARTEEFRRVIFGAFACWPGQGWEIVMTVRKQCNTWIAEYANGQSEDITDLVLDLTPKPSGRWSDL